MRTRINRSVSLLIAAALGTGLVAAATSAHAQSPTSTNYWIEAQSWVAPAKTAQVALKTQQAPTPRTSCVTAIPGVGPTYSAKLTTETSQVIVARGQARRSSYSSFDYWIRQSGCWTMVKTFDGRNGYMGWSSNATDGSGLSPIGVYGLTDAGGRLPNPGTALPYHYGPQAYARNGYKMNDNSSQVFDYVVAVNFNRFVGDPPRSDRRPDKRIRDGGIWFHTAGAGATRGCLSVPRSKMAWTLRWLDPKRSPKIVMGPQSTIAR